MKRGDVVLVRFPHPSGQRGKKRPAVVAQSETYATTVNTIVVAETTKNLTMKNDPACLFIAAIVAALVGVAQLFLGHKQWRTIYYSRRGQHEDFPKSEVNPTSGNSPVVGGDQRQRICLITSSPSEKLATRSTGVTHSGFSKSASRMPRSTLFLLTRHTTSASGSAIS